MIPIRMKQTVVVFWGKTKNYIYQWCSGGGAQGGSRKWHFRDSKLKNFLGPSTLAFSPPNQKELPTALLSIAFSLQFCWFYIHNTAAINKELSRRYFKIYVTVYNNIRLLAIWKIKTRNQSHSPSQKFSYFLNPASNWAKEGKFTASYFFTAMFFSLTNHTTECSFRLRYTTGFTSSKSSTETFNFLPFWDAQNILYY
jgi:hypothetical protein